MTDEAGTLRDNEYHPMAPNALKYVEDYLRKDLKRSFILIESLASCAISGNRLAEICSETLRRVRAGEPVSDRYVFGLAWYIKNLDHEQPKKPRKKTK